MVDKLALVVAGVALIVSIVNSAWQYREARRKRRPDVVIVAAYRPGLSGLLKGQVRDGFGSAKPVERLTGSINVTSTVTVTAAGIAPPRFRLGWLSCVARMWSPGRKDGSFTERMPGWASLPTTVQGGTSATAYVEIPDPLPKRIKRATGARMWVKTSGGHRFISTVVAPLPEPKADDTAP